MIVFVFYLLFWLTYPRNAGLLGRGVANKICKANIQGSIHKKDCVEFLSDINRCTGKEAMTNTERIIAK